MIRKLFKLSLRYLSFLTIRNKNKVIVGSWFGNKFADNSKFIYKRLNEDKEMRGIWITKNRDVVDEISKEGGEVYLSNSLKGIYHQLTASKYITSTGAGDVSDFLLSGATHIELWHGIPLKKIMYDDNISKDHVREEKNNLKNKLKNFPHDRSYYVVSTSKKISEIYESAFDINKENILELGQPRNDLFFDDRLDEKDFPKYIKERKIITYMPTHRNEGKTKMDLEKNFNFRELNEFCKKNNYLFIIKKHYYHKDEAINLDNYKNIIDLTSESVDSQMLLKYSDILITDYSSCYIDYLLLDRPVIFYNFDYDDYIKNDREMYFEYEDVTPGVKVNNFEELERELKLLIEDKIDYMNKDRNKIKDLFYSKENQDIVSNKVIERIKGLY